MEPVNIIDFATNSDFLGVDLYPAQATLLKVLACAVDLLTPFDDFMIRRWSSGFARVDDDQGARYVGSEGMPPDVLDRMTSHHQRGGDGFGEVALVIGRRGSKGLLSAILVAWRLHRLLLLDDPQGHYGIPATKPLLVQLYGANLDAAKRDIFGDVKTLIEDSPCFEPFVATVTADTITLFTPHQRRRGTDRGAAGLLRVTASPTTPTAGRGAAVPIVVLDEFAHLEQPGSSADSTALARAVRPAMAQFPDPLMILASSPWNKTGELHATYERGLQIDPATGNTRHPKLLVVQLPSWALYEGWEKADQTPMWPGGPCFAAKTGPILDRPTAEALIALDPTSGQVEYLAQFAAAVDAYLPLRFVQSIFAPWRGRQLTMTERGALGTRYAAHGDPSTVGNNFGFAIAHLEHHDGVPHVIFDVITYWDPADYPNGVIDYLKVPDEIYDYLVRFPITDLTFDQYQSAEMIQRLQARVRNARLPANTAVYERTATAASNWAAAEIFKRASMLGLIHAPPFQQAQLELEHLQIKNQRVAAPTAGPVKTDDVADAMIGCTWTLLGENYQDLFNQLATSQLTGSLPGGLPLRGPLTPPGDTDADVHVQLGAATRSFARSARDRRIRRL